MRCRHLADVQRLQIAPRPQILQNLDKPAQINGVLRQPASAINSHRDCIRGPLRKLEHPIEQSKCFDERRSVDKLSCRDNPRREHARPKPAQPAHQKFRQHSQPLLQAVVTRQPHFQAAEMAVAARCIASPSACRLRAAIAPRPAASESASGRRSAVGPPTPSSPCTCPRGRSRSRRSLRHCFR